MDNQHTLIKDRRYLTQDQYDLMHAVKGVGEQLRELISALEKYPDIDKRWLDIGRTDLQTGIMALVRSIARPTSF